MTYTFTGEFDHRSSMTTTQGKYIYIHTTGYGTTAVKGYALSQQVSITLTKYTEVGT